MNIQKSLVAVALVFSSAACAVEEDSAQDEGSLGTQASALMGNTEDCENTPMGCEPGGGIPQDEPPSPATIQFCKKQNEMCRKACVTAWPIGTKRNQCYAVCTSDKNDCLED